MARGTRDWGGSGQVENLHNLTDLAELAARLGALSVYDRGGSTIWFTGFEHGLSDIQVIGNIPPGHVEVHDIKAFFGSSALHIIAKTSPIASQGFNKIVRARHENKMAVEFTFSMISKPEFIFLDMFLDRGGQRTAGLLVLDPKNDRFRVGGLGQGFSDYQGLDFMEVDANYFSTVKFFLDFENGIFDKLLFDDKEFDLLGQKLPTEATSERDAFITRLLVTSDGLVDGEVLIDNVIITRNEE